MENGWLVCNKLPGNLLVDVTGVDVTGVSVVVGVVLSDAVCVLSTTSWLTEVIAVDDCLDASVVVADLLDCGVLPGDCLVDPVVIVVNNVFLFGT